MSSSLPQELTDSNSGRLACVGMGMTLGSHLTPLARSHIEQADVVFAAVSDYIAEMWLKEMHSDVRSLRAFYGENKPRSVTYQQWVDLMLEEVRKGKKVCGVFYGHPGIFAWSPHEAVRVARAEGYPAVMEPGISAEDCLYADIGFDPGAVGCQHFEASQLLACKHRVNPMGYVVLWQVGVAGDLTVKHFTTRKEYQQLLVERLSNDYPVDHEVIAYRAATLPIQKPIIRHMKLKDLPDGDLTGEYTVVLPPAAPLTLDEEFTHRLKELDSRSFLELNND